MSWVLLPTELVVAIHDAVLNPGELQGLALDKSLEGTLARVDHRIAYGMIADVFDLAAAYGEAVSQGHCFNDANKRTAYEVMVVVLQANGVRMAFEPEVMGPKVIALAQGAMSAEEMAGWLREVGK
ncbi:type II toxin-antitoxin system death-on-curing family toxin [Hasllibacter sp. MH4015]|uniref:type II toxin-antitoxin system death-on-curing family toxin n=1 Tax=Hasllibacter sp. MH4015 TaxID=2854029 RepID=UPI001CD277EE|nr:type II toxin-antitoxin system death-on-curing family toxin [Hasllibacter sp. MH4015]